VIDFNKNDMEAENNDTPTKRKGILRQTLTSILTIIMLGLAVHLILPQLAEFQHSVQVVNSMRWWGVGLAILAQVMSYVGSGILFQAVVALSSVTVSMFKSILITLAAASIGLIAGGMVGSSAGVYTWMRGSNVKRLTAMLASTLPPFIINLALILVSIFGVIHLFIAHELSTFQTISFAFPVIFSSFMIALAIWGANHRTELAFLVESSARKAAHFFHRPYVSGRMENSIHNIFEAWDVLIERGWQKTALGAVVSVGFDMLTIYFLFIAARYPISPAILLVGYGIPILLGKIAFFIPGGVGVVETSMAAIYTGLGVPESVAVVVILIYRGISFWLPTIIGFPVAAHLQRAANKTIET